MTKTMRIMMLLLLTMVGAGQTWAETDEPSNIKRGTITGGSIAFYADEACTSDFEGDVAANATVYVKATPEPGNTAIGVTFTVKKSISSDAMQAPRRSAEGPGIAADITVSAVTGKPGIYSFTMPNAENTNVTVNATFATPAQQLVSYVDENYETHEVDAYVLDETMSVLPVGFYVVPAEGLSLDHGISGNSGSGSVAIIIPDGKTLAVNGSFGMGCSLSFFGQANATGKLDINATGNGISIGGSVTVAHLDVDIVSKNSNGIGCSNGVTIIGCANGSNMVKVHSANTCISGGQKSVTIKYCDVDVVCEGSMIAIDCLASVTIEGVSTGAQVNTVNVRSAGDCIGTSNNPVTISYCNVEMTGTTQTDNVYDACGSSGINTSGGVVITGRTDVTNTLKVRCGGNTTSICYGIAGGQKAVSISRYNVNIVNENFYGIYTSDDVTITGGQVEITGGTKGAGIHSGNGIITLGWITPTDYIKASSYFVNGIKSMKTAEGQRFVAYDGDYATAVFSGSISGLDNTFIGNLAGKTLRPLDGNVFTKYVPQDKPGSFTIALPALPDGAAYSFTKTDEGGIIASHAYDAEQNTLTYITNSGKTSGTTATITVAATGTNNNDDYSFTLNVVVSEYTTAYAWDPQTNIYLIGNDWAFYKRDQVERAYHDNELVWSADGITLNTSLITIQNGETVSDIGYTAKVGETVLGSGENTLVLAPGAYRIEIIGDDGKLDDWVDFKVIKLVEDENFEFNVSNVINAAPEEAEAKGLRVSSGGKTGEWTGDVVLKYNGEDVKNSENTTIWYRGTGFGYDDDELYQNTTYRTPAVGMTGYHTTYIVGHGKNSEMRVYNVNNGSASLDGVSQISTVCGKLVWHGEGEEIKRKLDLDDMPISSGVDGGYVYYVGVDCPDFYLKEDGKVYYKDKTGEHLEAENKTYTDGKDIFYAGGETIYTYTDFICYGAYTFTLDDDDPVPLCENRKALGDIIGYCNCPKDEHGNCTSCFSQNGNTITICGETIEMGPYIVVGTNFILTGNRAIYNIVPSVEYKIVGADFDTEINGSTISFLGHSINAGNKPIIKGNFWLVPQQVGGCGIYVPCAYARYETAPYCYVIARRDIHVDVRRSVVSIEGCKPEYKVGEDVDMKISSCSYKYPDDTETYYGSTGDIKVLLNNVYYKTLSASNSHDLCFSDLPAGTYKLEAVLAGDQGYVGASTTTTFKVVRTNSEVTLTGKQNTAGDEFETGANIEYDPENPIVVNAVNDQTVSNTYWKWQISNTSDAGVVEIDNIVNESENNAKNSEDINLYTIGLGTVTLKAGFSGNDKYNPATGSITFTVVPKKVTSPIIELVDQSTIYHDGTAKEPAVKVYYAEGKEIPADQYDVTYANNTNVSSTNSKAKIIVKSKTGALYTIDAEKEFEIQETIVLFAANSTNLWATFCSQNEYEVPEGCTAYTISSISGSTVMLSDALTTVPAYTPVLIQRDANVTLPVTAIYKAAGAAPASGYDAQTGLAWTPGTAFTFYGNCLSSDVRADDFKGYYNEGQTYLLYNGKFILADENGGLGAHKCLLVLNGTNNAPVLSIGTETTSLSPVPSPSREGSSQRWYTLDGRKLNGKPTQKGIYVNGGRKVVIK